MAIEKILTVIGDKEYSLTVEILDAEEGKVYRVVPDQGEHFLDNIVPGYIEFDAQGNVMELEKRFSDEGKEIADAIWRSIKEQILNEHPSFNRPLE